MSVPRHRRYPLLRAKRGRCRFCGEACDPHRTWHDACGELYETVTRAEKARVFLAGRDGPRCRACGFTVDGPLTPGRLAVFEVDHIVPLALGAGRPAEERRALFLPSNLQLLCGKCHAAKTEEDRRLIREMRRSGRREDGKCR